MRRLVAILDKYNRHIEILLVFAALAGGWHTLHYLVVVGILAAILLWMFLVDRIADKVGARPIRPRLRTRIVLAFVAVMWVVGFAYFFIYCREQRAAQTLQQTEVGAGINPETTYRSIWEFPEEGVNEECDDLVFVFPGRKYVHVKLSDLNFLQTRVEEEDVVRYIGNVISPEIHKETMLSHLEMAPGFPEFGEGEEPRSLERPLRLASCDGNGGQLKLGGSVTFPCPPDGFAIPFKVRDGKAVFEETGFTFLYSSTGDGICERVQKRSPAPGSLPTR